MSVSYNDIGTQLMGAGNPVSLAPSLITAGGSLLENLGGLLFGGHGGDRKRLREYAQWLKGSMTDPANFAEQRMAQNFIANAPQFNALTRGINKRLDLDSGVAQAEIGSSQQATEAQQRLALMSEADQRNMQIKQMLSHIYENLLG